MTKKVLIGIDPGVTTGLAIVTIEDGNIIPLVFKDRKDIRDIIFIIDTAIGLRKIETIIVEDFIGGGFRSKETKQTIELLGFVKHYYKNVMKQKVTVQQPQFRKHAYQESKAIAKKYDLSKPHHAKDAMAHIIAYCIKEYNYEKKFDLPS